MDKNSDDSMIELDEFNSNLDKTASDSKENLIEVSRNL